MGQGDAHVDFHTGMEDRRAAGGATMTDTIPHWQRIALDNWSDLETGRRVYRVFDARCDRTLYLGTDYERAKLVRANAIADLERVEKYNKQQRAVQP